MSRARSGRMRLDGRQAVVTGAAGGLGRAIAAALAGRGTHLVLLDVDEAGLAETAARLAPCGVRVSRYRVDVADGRAAHDARRILADHPAIDLLVNNAGVALGGRFEQVDDDELERLFQVNFWGVVRMTRAFLPALRRSDDACIVNISSLFGLVAPAGQAGYAASKFAVRGFSHALAAELADSPVAVLVIHPGGIATGIAANARMASSMPAAEAERLRTAFGRHLRLAPERAAERIMRAVERRRSRATIGLDARLLALVERALPERHGRLLARLGLAG